MMPDPECKDCKGKGEILLLNRTVKCLCLDRTPSDEIIICEEDFTDLSEEFRKKLNEQYPNWHGGI